MTTRKTRATVIAEQVTGLWVRRPLLLMSRSLMRSRAFRSHHPTQTEVALCASHVFADLLAESVWIGPTDFVAQALQKGDCEGRGFGEFDGVEVEDVRLDGEGVGPKGGTVANVGDGVERFIANFQCGDVDAVGGDEFGVGCEVDCGDGVACAVSAPRGRSALNVERAAEKRARLVHIASGDELPDAAGGDRQAAND